MAGVAVLLQMVPLAPELLGVKAQSDPSGRYIRFQPSQSGPQIGEASPLLMDLRPPATRNNLGNLPLGPRYPPTQAVELQLLLLTDRRRLAFQRHPHSVEHPARYLVPPQVLALQRCRQTASRHIGEKIPLHAPVEFTVGRQRRGACLTINAGLPGDARLVRTKT